MNNLNFEILHLSGNVKDNSFTDSIITEIIEFLKNREEEERKIKYFCKKCFAPLEDEASICPLCGK